MHRFSCLVSISPVVRCSDTVLPNVEVLWIVDVFVGTGLNAIDDLLFALDHSIPFQSVLGAYTGFQINQNSSWDVSGVVALVEEYVLPVTAFCRKVLEVSVLTDAVFLT